MSGQLHDTASLPLSTVEAFCYDTKNAQEPLIKKGEPPPVVLVSASLFHRHVG